MSDGFDEPLITGGVEQQKGAHGEGGWSFRVHYALLFWIIFGFITLFAILDRYILFLWLCVGTPGGTYEACVNQAPFVGGFAVQLFGNIARISGRLSIVTTNALFITMCRTTWELITTRVKFVEMGDIRAVNTQIHYFLGVVFMAIPMMLHVWSIFFPAMAGTPLNVFPNRPPGTPFYIPPIVGGDPGGVNLASNDLYRLVLMTVIFGVIFPWTMSNKGRKSKFSLTIWAHLICGFLFTIDLLRQPSHPHAEIFNTPVVIYWMVDRLVGMYWFRTQDAVIVHKEILDGQYVVVLLNVMGQKRNPSIGSAYWFNFPNAVIESSHPFTVFQNRTQLKLFRLHKDASAGGHVFSVSDSGGAKKKMSKKAGTSASGGISMQSMGDAVDFLADDEIVDTEDIAIFDTDWNVALLVAIHPRRGSWSQRLADAPIGTRLKSWGPYSTEYRNLALDLSNMPPLILLATGAGAAYIVDFYMYISSRSVELTNPVTVYFSTNSVGVFQFFTDLCCSGAITDWTVNAHLTRHDDELEYDEDNNPDFQNAGADRDSQMPEDAKSGAIAAHIGRLSFKDVIHNADRRSTAYFCGAPTLQWQCKILCAERGIEFREGHTFSTTGMIKVKKAGNKILCRCTGFPCCWCY